MGLIIYTGGTFDLFHAGHVQLLRKCSALGNVVVALNTDDFITTYKGKPPVMTYTEREAVLQACRYVDKVIPNYGGPDSKPAILSAKPDLIVIGSDWARRDYHKQMQFDQDWLDKYDIGLAYVPYSWGISSTEIKQRIAID
jgi:glycerol-3-phosphate cytidylyltransferase